MARTRPYLDAIGQSVFEFGDDPGAAAAVKLAGNFLILAAMESMAEAFLLAEREGVDRTAVMRMLTETLFAAPVYKNYGPMVAARDFGRHSKDFLPARVSTGTRRNPCVTCSPSLSF